MTRIKRLSDNALKRKYREGQKFALMICLMIVASALTTFVAPFFGAILFAGCVAMVTLLLISHTQTTSMLEMRYLFNRRKK